MLTKPKFKRNTLIDKSARFVLHYKHGQNGRKQGVEIMKSLAEKTMLVETARLQFKSDMQTINQQIEIKADWSDFADRCDLIAAKIDRIKLYNQEIHSIFHG